MGRGNAGGSEAREDPAEKDQLAVKGLGAAQDVGAAEFQGLLLQPIQAGEERLSESGCDRAASAGNGCIRVEAERGELAPAEDSRACFGVGSLALRADLGDAGLAEKIDIEIGAVEGGRVGAGAEAAAWTGADAGGTRAAAGKRSSKAFDCRLSRLPRR